MDDLLVVVNEKAIRLSTAHEEYSCNSTTPVQVYIQNEFCEGGSLQNRIQEFRQTAGRFSETELKKIIVHVAKVRVKYILC